MGSGEWGKKHYSTLPTPHSPLPTPHSPTFLLLLSLLLLARADARQLAHDLPLQAAEHPVAAHQLRHHRFHFDVLLEQRSEEHTSELQSLRHLVCRLLLEKK